MRSALIAAVAASLVTPWVPASGSEVAQRGVGFEKHPLKVIQRDGGTRSTTLFLWYPATAPSGRHDYDGQVGFATPDAEVAAGRYPLLLFSHGFLGGGDQSIFLTEALARSGYVVAALDHADASGSGTPREIPPFLDPGSWDEHTQRDRADDLRFLLDHVLARARREGDRLYRHIDPGAVGGIGHSLGGYALLGIAGAWPSWRDERVRACALLSPYSAPYLGRARLAVDVPVMLQGGSFDIGITPALPRLYELLRPAKYLLVLRAENHFGWTNFACLSRTTLECVAGGNPAQIVAFSIAFFDRHLRGRTAAMLHSGDPALDSYRSQAN